MNGGSPLLGRLLEQYLPLRFPRGTRRSASWELDRVCQSDQQAIIVQYQPGYAAPEGV